MPHNNINRIIDANINRASEALRVLEDWARYAKDNKIISEKLKNIRHKINVIFSNHENLILSRESINDVGKEIKNPSKRNTIHDIISANSKRLEEALRVLSEYSQLLNVDTKMIDHCRYETYTIEKELIINEKLFRLQNSSLYLITNRDGFKNDNDFLNIIEKSIEGGVDIIQLREKNENENKILKLAKEIKKLILNTDVLFIVNDRVDLALAADADGVHLGQDDLLIKDARKITPDGFIIGLSTHNIEQGVRALHVTPLPDYLGVGPVFPTPTKPDYKVAGLEYVRWAIENIKDLPWFAIGGIDESNIETVKNAGAKKVSIVRAIMNAKDPLITTRKLVETLHATSLQCNKKTYAEI